MKYSPLFRFSLLFALTSASPIRAELTDAQVASAVQSLDALAQKAMAQVGIPGMAVGVMHRDKILLLKGYGVREAGKPDPVDEHTVFMLASVSKPITSTLIAKAVSDGKVRWDDTIQQYLPWFTLENAAFGRAVTLRDMVCHRSGLPNHAGDLIEDLGFDRETILRRLANFPVGNRFRAVNAYTNFGFTAAGEAVAKAYGTTFEELVAQELFEPLGMKTASAQYEDFQARKNKAVLHFPEGGALSGGPFLPLLTRNPDAQSPAGGMSASISDMMSWVKLHLASGAGLIKHDVLRATYEPQITTNFDPVTLQSGFYGLAWNTGFPDTSGHLWVNHSGEFLSGARTIVALLPGEQLGLVVLVNAAPNGVPEALSQSFREWIATGQTSRDWIKVAEERFAQMTAKELEGDGVDYKKRPDTYLQAGPPGQLTGQYSNPTYGNARVLQVKEGLVLEMGPGEKTIRWPLLHYSGDTYFFQTTGENMSGLRGVKFTIEGDTASTMLINALNRNGMGTFQRE